MDLVTPGLGLIFWSTITFILLLWLLKRFAWKPILGAVKSREESIKSALAAAEEAKKEMQNLTADSEKLLKEARLEREALLKEAREIRDKMVSDAKDQAQVEGDKMIRQAQAAIESEKKAALADIKSQVAELSVAIAEKVINEKFSDKAKQLELVDGMLGDLKLK